MSEETIRALEQDRIRLQTELDVIRADLSERLRELQKERLRIENMIRQEQVKSNGLVRHRLTPLCFSSADVSNETESFGSILRRTLARMPIAQVQRACPSTAHMNVASVLERKSLAWRTNANSYYSNIPICMGPSERSPVKFACDYVCDSVRTIVFSDTEPLR